MARFKFRNRRMFAWFCIIIVNIVLTFSDPREEFYSHVIVKPLVYSETRGKRDLKPNQVQNEKKLTVTFSALGKEFDLDLLMNSLLLPSTYFEKYRENGTDVMRRPMKNNAYHCHYQGKVRGKDFSFVAVSTCRGLSGVINDGNESYYIEPDTSSDDNSHFFFCAKDMKPKNVSCGVSDSEFSSNSEYLESFEREKRFTVSKDYNQRYGNTLYLELLLVNDFTYYQRRRGDVNFLNQRAKELINMVNGIYLPLNIRVALVGVITLYRYEFPFTTNGDQIVRNFAKYRADTLNKQYPNDNAHLIIYMEKMSDDEAIGKATLNSMCTHKDSSGWTRDHSDVNFQVAATIAHEIGHNFGMNHDEADCSCAEYQCIMYYSGSHTRLHHWSSCSVKYMEGTFARGLDVCLKNYPSYTGGSVCGNGFLESGEECDCGMKEHCVTFNKCCDAATCRLLPNAVCGNGECCDISTCKPKKERTQCRDPVSECDVPEFCDGKSANCPSDFFYMNGHQCKDGEAYCYNGQCQSHSGQCMYLWGQGVPTGGGDCYQFNSQGQLTGNCGHDKISKAFRPCAAQDNFCGRLQCVHEGKALKIGYPFANQMGYIRISKGSAYETCQSAVIDFGTVDKDPGMVPDGAKCGDKMMCIDQRCVSTSQFNSEECSKKCNEHGKCNNNGNCHCDYGREPPDCLKPGLGGSIDSSSASDVSRERMVLALYIVFLGVVPLSVIAIILVLYYRKRRYRFRRF